MSRRRGPRWTATVVTAFALVTVLACGSDTSGDETSPTATLTNSAAASTAEPEPESAPSTVTMTVTETVAAPGGSGGSGGGGSGDDGGELNLTVTDLERALEEEIARDHSYVAPGKATCEASGLLAEWSAVRCDYWPDETAEFGGIHVSMLDGGRYAWGLSLCCGGEPSVHEYGPGLFCRDLAQPPPDEQTSRWSYPDYHLNYGVAVYYWLTEGRPARMDADGNGRPCETIYPTAEVNAYWNSVKTLQPSG